MPDGFWGFRQPKQAAFGIPAAARAGPISARRPIARAPWKASERRARACVRARVAANVIACASPTRPRRRPSFPSAAALARALEFERRRVRASRAAELPHDWAARARRLQDDEIVFIVCEFSNAAGPGRRFVVGWRAPVAAAQDARRLRPAARGARQLPEGRRRRCLLARLIDHMRASSQRPDSSEF